MSDVAARRLRVLLLEDDPDDAELELTLLARAGFAVERIWYYFSPRALRTLELGHYFGLPNLISKKITGRWVLFPSPRNPFLRALEASLRPLYNESLPEIGAYIFCVAQKRPS